MFPGLEHSPTTEESNTDDSIPRRTADPAPSLLGVNSIYLISMILILTLGTSLQAWDSGIGLLLTEIGLIWLPAFLFLWRSNLPVDETIRWRWPGVMTSGFAVLAGIGFSFFTIWLAESASDLFGYTLWLPPQFYPRTFSEGLILFTGLVIAAPLCEEFLFRGVIQRGYGRVGARAAIITVRLHFADPNFLGAQFHRLALGLSHYQHLCAC